MNITDDEDNEDKVELTAFTEIDTRLAVKKTLNDKKLLKIHKSKIDKSKQLKTQSMHSVDSTKRGWKAR